jgi:hypothetical protein
MKERDASRNERTNERKKTCQKGRNIEGTKKGRGGGRKEGR